MACKKVSDDLVKMFESMDADGNGSLDYAEVKECLKKGNCKLPESQIQVCYIFFFSVHLLFILISSPYLVYMFSFAKQIKSGSKFITADLCMHSFCPQLSLCEPYLSTICHFTFQFIYILFMVYSSLYISCTLASVFNLIFLFLTVAYQKTILGMVQGSGSQTFSGRLPLKSVFQVAYP